MATGNIFRSDLYQVHNIVANAAVVVPKSIIIANLRSFFSRDRWYRYAQDEWGFPLTKELSAESTPLGSGFFDSTVTRLYIGEQFPHEIIHFPAILVKHGGVKSVPLSINREKGKVKWSIREFDDGYGNLSFYRYPEKFLFEGIYEGTLTLDIMSRSLRGRDDITDLCMMFLQDIGYDELVRAGIMIKPPQASFSEGDDRNDKLFKSTITCDFRTEWRREIPVQNVIEVINFSVDFGFVANPNYPVSPNLRIDTYLQETDKLMNSFYKVVL